MLDVLFGEIGITRNTGRLMVMLALFAALFVARAIVVAARDVLLSRSTIEFIDHRRRQVVGAIAGARWDVIARLNQARVTQILGSEVQNVATAARLLQIGVVAAATLLGQCVAAIVLSPRLSLLCFALIAVGGLALAKTLRQAHSLGRTIVEGNLAAMNTLTQFFGGLKLAVSQDLQSSYVDEVDGALRQIADHQTAFVRDQARRQVVLGTSAALAGMAVASAGLLIFHLPPPVLVGLLLILLRMNGPAAILRQQGLQLVQILPAYRALTDLQAELSAAARDPVLAAADRDFAGDIEFRAGELCSSWRWGQRARRLLADDRARRIRRADRAIGRGQDDPGRSAGRIVRTAGGRDHDRRRATQRRGATRVAPPRELYLARPVFVSRQHPAQSALGQSGGERGSAVACAAAGGRRWRWCSGYRAGSTRWSANAAR